MLDIDWSNFTPTSATLGGCLIGTAAAMMLYTTGRIAGISGIVGGLLKPSSGGERMWRGAFVGGLVAGGAFTHLLLNESVPEIPLDYISLIAGGMLVGFGTRLGNGCTSGHGVCGLSRFSGRSLAATLTFMTTGVISAIVAPALSPTSKLLLACSGVTTAALMLLRSRSHSSPSGAVDTVPTMHAISTGVSGLVFGSGLALSGMTNPAKVASFLKINEAWDPSLMFVMGAAVVLGSLTFNYILPKNTKDNVDRIPLFARKWYVVSRSDIDLRLIAGAAMFGAGWGLAGMCPGPALVVSPHSTKGVVFAGSMLSSMALFNAVS